ncbi:heat-inducible transcriptional repressor HrcA [Irregularibacter muris]|uniref:Heat-inducible transcription repressor HrcA n=1 Tax=Irregularibacter muris TaxID=1796619 RepID=A0AAE3HEU2_9FIRM|nr:heat-inducible transcriptional repressor HrcA [Irregularibacter muris]MCR1897844.1 heat-inducible transcriptional repressor HrcA [Irregularibacter muris]
MGLKERKLKILHAIIQDYISTAEPVGSRTIAKNYNLGISSATVRNEMADLEEMGFLEQPHTSAGRIPSDKAYRLYVDQLMRVDKINKALERNILREYENYMGELEKIIQHTSKILSHFTNYTSLVLTPQVYESSIKHIQLMPLQEDKILMVIITKEGMIKNIVVKVNTSIDSHILVQISNILNKYLQEFSIAQVQEEILPQIRELSVQGSKILEQLIPLIRESLVNYEDTKVYFDGITNIFNFPEFKDIERAKEFIDLWERKNLLVDLLSPNAQDDLHISIGAENQLHEIKDCSLITATYKLNGKLLGTIGVIGPTRMQYGKVVSIMNYLTGQLDDMIGKGIKD